MFTRVTTDIGGLDEIVDGGLPRPAAISLVGEMGSGKSLLARQISWNLLRKGFDVLYYSVDDSAMDVRDYMRYQGWDITRYEQEGKFHFVDIFLHATDVTNNFPDIPFSEQMKQIFDFNELLKEGNDFCLRKMAGKDLLIIVDSLDPLITLLDEEAALGFLKEMKSITRASQCIGIAIANVETHDSRFKKSYIQIADMVIELNKIGYKRYIRISKSPEISRDKPYYLEIDRKHGITIYPTEELSL
ncbi:MAG: hypothetical protein QG670_815 [Thermoproteota archaeon]|nr:hypothetical protein [Thermoproteota archaeon]